MEKVFAVLGILICSTVSGQQYGIQWVLSDDSTSSLDFRNDTLTNYHIAGDMPMFLTSANICDSLGNLLFYTNGIFIADKNGDTVLNGDGLNPCSYTQQWVCCGLDIPQAALFLPMPGNSRYYYLIHCSNDGAEDLRPGTIYYSLIDAEGNSGLGTVLQKNVPFFKEDTLREGGITACKHANGRDYWIVVLGSQDNVFNKFLLTPDTILGPFIQSIGPAFTGILDVAYSKFSQDGSTYVTSCYAGPILVMDFDRCTGMFSNPITIFNNSSGNPQQSLSGATSEEFSPNGRFIYATNTITLNQFDLNQSNPQLDSIAIYNENRGDPCDMEFLQLAPNGKIFFSCHNGGGYFLHSINYPDSEGASCGYIDTAFITFTANVVGLPNMINYNLGPLVGSPCDTDTTVEINQIASYPGRLLRVLPNPADKYLYVEMGMPASEQSGRQGNYEFQLLNALGQVVDVKETRQVDIFDTEKLASGVYFVKAIDKNNSGLNITKQVVVQQ